MKLIDAHIHLWDVSRMTYPWLQDNPLINKSFSVPDYQEATRRFEIESMAFVQAECLPAQAFEEITFVMEQAERDARIRAIVAYAALEKGPAIEPHLQQLKSNPLIKGVRRMSGNEAGLCLSSNFLAAVHLLNYYEMSLDLSIQPYQVEETISMIKQCPDNFFILDHLGKPAIAKNEFQAFAKDIKRLAAFPNVVAKLSGLITEANWNSWETETVRPYIEFAVEKFGCERLMFGSDYPVLLLAGTYDRWLDTLLSVTSQYTATEQHSLFYNTAKKTYAI